MDGKRAAIEVRQLLLLWGQRALSSPLGWEQTVLSQKEGQKETMLDHASPGSHPTRAGGDKTEHLFAVLSSQGV